jgi:hypothetical protein
MSLPVPAARLPTSHSILPQPRYSPVSTRLDSLCTELRSSAQKSFPTMKNGVLWDVTLCGSCKNRRFGETERLLHQGDKNR